jgi:hypothetical protein
MANRAVGVDVEGLIAMKKAFRLAHDGTQRAIQRRLKEVATLVASEVAGRVPVRTGRAASSVRALATQESASVAAGGARAPYYAFLDFGGSTGRGHVAGVPDSGSVKRAWYGRGGAGAGEGRYLYPAIREMGDVIARQAGEAVHEALADAGFKAG